MTIRSAFTYIEFMIVVVIIAILTALAMPLRETAEQEEIKRATAIFESDVDYARSQSIARPDSPLVLKVDTANHRYWLANKSTPDTPITHPQTGSPFVRQFGPTAAQGLRDVQIKAVDFAGDAVLAFDPCGTTDQDTPAVLKFATAKVELQAAVSPAAAKVTTSELVSLASENLATEDASEADAKTVTH